MSSRRGIAELVCTLEVGVSAKGDTAEHDVILMVRYDWAGGEGETEIIGMRDVFIGGDHYPDAFVDSVREAIEHEYQEEIMEAIIEDMQEDY